MSTRNMLASRAVPGGGQQDTAAAVITMTTTAAMTKTTKADMLLAGRSGLGAARRSISDNFKKASARPLLLITSRMDGESPSTVLRSGSDNPAGTWRSAATSTAATMTTATTGDVMDYGKAWTARAGTFLCHAR